MLPGPLMLPPRMLALSRHRLEARMEARMLCLLPRRTANRNLRVEENISVLLPSRNQRRHRFVPSIVGRSVSSLHRAIALMPRRHARGDRGARRGMAGSPLCEKSRLSDSDGRNMRGNSTRRPIDTSPSRAQFKSLFRHSHNGTKEVRSVPLPP